MHIEPKLQLIRTLLKKRAEKSFVARLLGRVEDLSDSELMGSPEATIVTIVETYLELHHGGAPDDEIFKAIESHRQITGSNQLPRPLNLDNYIRYRLDTEHKTGKRMSDAEIDFAIFASRNFFTEFLGLYRDKPGVSLPPNLPDVTTRRPSRAFALGDYIASFLENVPSVAKARGHSSIFEYPYVMTVTPKGEGQDSILYVTLEKGIDNKLFLCTFDRNLAHKNYGSAPELLDSGRFIARAIRLICQELNISGGATELR